MQCEKCGLVVEVDGSQHGDDANKARDETRTQWLTSNGYRVLRFWNNDVLQNMDGVLQTILETLRTVPPHPNPLPEGEREQT